jgi:hypothetical protein
MEIPHPLLQAPSPPPSLAQQPKAKHFSVLLLIGLVLVGLIAGGLIGYAYIYSSLNGKIILCSRICRMTRLTQHILLALT